MDIETGVKNIIIDVLDLDLTPDELDSSTPLLQGGLELNSVVGLQILVLLERQFDFEIGDSDLTKDLFTDINHLVDFVRRKTQPDVASHGSA